MKSSVITPLQWDSHEKASTRAWTDYMHIFVPSWRYAVATVPKKDRIVFRPYIQEHLLPDPIQIEVCEFKDPCRLIWLFLLDKTRRDITVSVPQKLRAVSTLVEKLKTKYPELDTDWQGVSQMIRDCLRPIGDNFGYGINCRRNVLQIYFPYDPRKGKNLMGIEASAEAFGDFLFRHNYGQCYDAHYAPILLDRAVTALNRSYRARAMKDVFPEDLQALLNFKWKDKWLIVKPKESLNSQNFAKILTVIKQLNGIYKIRMPLKRSYFEIPLT